jgi:hypothetical protein
MNESQRLKWNVESYERKLEANRGSNFEYWSEKHDKMLKNGWDLFLIENKFSTPSELHAKEVVNDLRLKNNYSRIICGYDKNVQRIKMYSVIFKPKTK